MAGCLPNHSLPFAPKQDSEEEIDSEGFDMEVEEALELIERITGVKERLVKKVMRRVVVVWVPSKTSILKTTPASLNLSHNYFKQFVVLFLYLFSDLMFHFMNKQTFRGKNWVTKVNFRMLTYEIYFSPYFLLWVKQFPV